jgi:hypothetical protein
MIERVFQQWEILHLDQEPTADEFADLLMAEMKRTAETVHDLDGLPGLPRKQ